MVFIVLVHGLWHDEWAWSAVQQRLTAADAPSTAVHLPLDSLPGDAAAVRLALDRAPAPAVLIGHSYGGAVITASGIHPKVRRLGYVAAFQLAEGESISRTLPELGIVDTELSAALRISDDGSQISIDPDGARRLMYHDVSAEVTQDAIGRLRPVSRSLFRAVPDVIAWRSRPSSYLICSADRTVQPDLQRAMAARSQEAAELDCGHNAPLARPDDVAQWILRIAVAADQPPARRTDR